MYAHMRILCYNIRSYISVALHYILLSRFLQEKTHEHSCAGVFQCLRWIVGTHHQGIVHLFKSAAVTPRTIEKWSHRLTIDSTNSHIEP